ncbi:MAG: response regulator transcription factor [Anaerovoracaceae bacterium]
MIYCVEDEDNIRDLVVYALRTGGFEAAGFADGETFMREMAVRKPTLVLLDIMLPGEDGISILSRLKKQKDTQDIPVIMLTAKSAEYDKVQGLDLGADDYITKPFGVMELLSRVKAVLRRYSPKGQKEEICIGEVELDLRSHRVAAGGAEVILTLKEFELLHYMMDNIGIVLSRDKILEAIWGYDYGGETRTVDVHVSSLRTKLGAYGDMIETVRGIGYRIEAKR